ncbi:MAG: biotin/lipoyl-binding protein [bacterium]|nr:biotin/lipoyl-binding protein [bacterium]
MKKRKVLSLFLCCLALLGGCAAEQEKNNIPPLKNREEGISYTMAEVVYDDISVTGTILCTYRQAASYSLTFSLDGQRIDSVNVKKGEIVQKGQLLASLDNRDAETYVSALEHTLQADQLRLDQTVALRDFDLESAETLYYYTHMTAADKKALQEQRESVSSQYKNRIQDLEDAVALDTARLAQAREQLEKGRIYAPVTGEVTYALRLTGPSYSNTKETVVTVCDISTCYFESTDFRYRDYLLEGETYQVEYVKQGGSEFYEVVPVNMELWDETGCLQFALVSESVFPELATVGRMTVSLGERKNVLSVPLQALHSTEEGYFVYVLEDGIRQIREVTVGLSGRDKAEILSGLQEHDQVILSQKAGDEDED